MKAELYPISLNILERLRDSSQLHLERWLELLGVRSLDYTFASAQGTLQLTSEQISLLSDNLELNPEQILSGNIDFRAFAALHAGDSLAIPEHFSIAAQSKIRTSSHLLDMVEHRFGWQQRSSLLRSLQVSEAFLVNLDRQVNIRFYTAICDHLHRLGVTEGDFRALGGYSVAKNYHSPMGDLFRAIKPLPVAMEVAFNEIIRKFYDQNHLYRIKRAFDGFMIVEARFNPNVLDGLSVRKFGSARVCSARVGTFATVPGYARLPDAKVTESQCLHRGDSRCRYEIDYREALELSRHRRPF